MTGKIFALIQDQFGDVKKAVKEMHADTKKRILPYGYEARRDERGVVFVKIKGINGQTVERALEEIVVMVTHNQALPETHPSKWASFVLEMYKGAIEEGEAFERRGDE